MQAPQFLPSFLRSFLNWFFFSLLDEEDDFTQILRKVAATLLFLCAPLPFGLASFYAYRAAAGDPKYGVYVLPAFGYLPALLSIVNYFYLRSKRHMSDLNADVVFLWMAFSWFVVYFCTPEFDARTTSGAIAVICVLGQPPKLKVILAALFVVSVVSVYNEVYRDSGMTLLVIPGPFRPSSIAVNLVFHLSAMLGLTTAIAGVVAQAAAHVRALAASEAGVRMSNEVVDLLGDYNTHGVDEVLTAYAAQGEVNSSLIQSFRGINKNLERYRPHLPNYVLMREEEPEGKSPPAMLRASYPGDRGSSSHSEPSGGRDGRALDDESRRSTSKSDHLGNSLRTFHGRISFARVDLSGMLKDGSMVRDASAAFFDLLFQLAGTFHASVHATVGDVATLSWNATHRVAQPELKAAKLLLRLMNATKSLACAHPVSGAVFTGAALCDVVKATAAKQQAVLISAPWVEALDVAFRLARSARCGLIDAETNATATYEVETRAVDRVDYFPTDAAEDEFRASSASLMLDENGISSADAPTAPRRSVLYELVAELQRNDDEWMYQLQRTATQQTPAAVVTAAFEAAIDGRYGDAVSLLTSLPSELVEASPLVMRLKNSCERKLLLMAAP